MFLSIITRTYQRPILLAQNQESVRNQTDQDWEQILLIDRDGVGVAAANGNLRNVTVEGDYVLVLDDDNIIVDECFIANLKLIANDTKPDLIITRVQRDEKRVFPLLIPPVNGSIDTANMVVSKDTWYKYRKAWPNSYSGDFYFAKALFENGVNYVEYVGIPIKSLRISRGSPEDVQIKGNKYMSVKIGDKVNIKIGCGGPWGHFQQCDSPVTITEKNIDIIESLVRGGTAELIGGDKRPIEKVVIKGSPAKNEDTDILSDSTKIGKRGRKRNLESGG